MNAALDVVLDAWDTLRTFVSYERTPPRAAWLRRNYEIEGSIDEWIENKEAGVIEQYSTLRKISYDEAMRELQDRPVKPWPDASIKRNPPSPKLRVRLRTSKDGWNTWTFSSFRGDKMKVWERADALFQADGVAVGVGQTLSGAVLEIREKQVNYMKQNELENDLRARDALRFIDQVVHYLKTQIEV